MGGVPAGSPSGEVGSGEVGSGDPSGLRMADGVTEVLRSRLPWIPEVLLILGSGAGALADEVEHPIEVPFQAIPGFPLATVTGHSGRFVAGILQGRRVLVQAGRLHLYEGHSAAVVGASVRAAGELGIRTLIVTNASGGIRSDLVAGDLLILRDHLNLMGTNPLRGAVLSGEERFPDLSEPYDPELRRRARAVADRLGIPLTEGVYAAVQGPSYETPAEVRMIEILGGDVVGMSTVPEVIVARARGMRVLGLSLIANPAAGRSASPLSHAEVLEVVRSAAPRWVRLLRAILEEL